ncbi:MAG TPA: hypothetical protein VF910_03165 [Candidatus Bathyarchaeia archaeon]
MKPFTTTVVAALRTSPVAAQPVALQALRVSENLVSAVALKEIFTVEVPPEATGTEAGVKVVVRPVTGEAAAKKNTVPLNPLRLVSVPVITVGEAPFGILTVVGVTDHE